jgi:hypothetical protein
MSGKLQLAGKTVMGIALATLSIAAFADIYVSRDANGHLVYSDRKPAGPSEPVRIAGRPSADKPASEADAPDPAAWQKADNALEERMSLAEQERIAAIEERAKRCAAARQQGAMFALNAPRCTYDGEGVRSCLSSAEIDAKRLEAKQQMAEFCAGQR